MGTEDPACSGWGLHVPGDGPKYKELAAGNLWVKRGITRAAMFSATQ